MTKLQLDPATQKIVDDFDAHAKKRFTEMLGDREGSPLQATSEICFCLGYKAGVIDLGAEQRRRLVMKVQNNWAVTARYAAPGSRPRHPAPEFFRRRTVVGPPTPMTVEAVLDMLEVPEDVRVKIRAHRIVQDFVEGKLVPDHPYLHLMTGGHYIHINTPEEQFVEWDLAFVFVTRIIEEAS